MINDIAELDLTTEIKSKCDYCKNITLKPRVIIYKGRSVSQIKTTFLCEKCDNVRKVIK